MLDEDLKALFAMSDAFANALTVEYLKIRGKDPEVEVMLLSMMIDNCNIKSVMLKYAKQISTRG